LTPIIGVNVTIAAETGASAEAPAIRALLQCKPLTFASVACRRRTEPSLSP
jgi:hypothetical protein